MDRVQLRYITDRDKHVVILAEDAKAGHVAKIILEE